MIELNITRKLQASGGPMKLHVDTILEEGRIFALYGSSGAGKTSLLRMIAGLMRPDKGRILINGSCWFDHSRKINLPPQKRTTGFVFQDYALFPNLTVEGNLKYAVTGNGQIVNEILERFDLYSLKDQKPQMLSGGQQQRVALARALVQAPKILLLDEPLSALDHSLRKNLQEYITEINRKMGSTVILVSHDLGEIYRTAHEVLVLENGKVIQKGIPKEVFAKTQVSGKFRFTGEILSIQKEDIIYVARVLIGSDVIKVVVDPGEINELQVGDKVMVASKAFNPIIQRIG
jgi:molybdate transport system ATP-binding protein